MIPNKIYFPADGLPAYIDWDGSPIRTKQVEDSDICYIRKDALLEWAKVHQEGERQGSYTWSCYQIFIDKLNEM